MKIQQPIQLSFTLSEPEFVAAHRAHLRRSLLTFRNLAFLLIAATLSFAQAQVLSAGSGPLLFVGMILGGVLLLVAYVYLFVPSKIYRSKAGALTTSRLRLSDDGVTFEEPASGLISWDQIQDVRQSDRIFLLLRKGHLPILIPERAFPDQASIEAFRKMMESASKT